MKNLRDIIPVLFDDSEIDRVDYHIDKIKESLSTTNRLFITYVSFLGLSIIAFHLYIYGYLYEINIFGQKLSQFILIKRWFLLIPSILFFLSSLLGYLRVYQMECIEWLIAKHRNKEFTSEIFRLALPSSYILGLDILRRQNDKWIKLIASIPSIILAFGTIIIPILYVNCMYGRILKDLLFDYQTIVSCLISNLFIICGILIIRFSQRI